MAQFLHAPHSVYVYVAHFDNGVCVRDVLPASRNEYVASAANSLVRAQRYCVWRLLDVALTQCTGKGVADLSLVRCDDGLWRCAAGGVYFSLSHSGNAVAAAVSGVAVGVDVELYRAERFNSRLARRIASDDELRAYSLCAPSESGRFVAELWARRESAFKYYRNCAHDGSLQSSAPAPDTCCRWISVGGAPFVLSVSASPARCANTSPAPDTVGTVADPAASAGNFDCVFRSDTLSAAPCDVAACSSSAVAPTAPVSAADPAASAVRSSSEPDLLRVSATTQPLVARLHIVEMHDLFD